MQEKLREIKKRYDEIVGEMADFNSGNYQRLAREQKRLQPIIDLYARLLKVESDLAVARRLRGDAEFAALADAEIAELEPEAEALREQIGVLLIPRDERDDSNVIIEIRPAAGGDEAALFAASLLRMYSMYATANGFSVEINDITETEIGGVKEVSFMVVGEGAFARFKYESGVHRVQRVPDTETQGRIHTSTCTVAVLPEAVAVDFKIDEKDLKIDTYRASGAGGQHVNRTESAIRITHLPTGMVVTCQDGRSQLKNREKAMMILQAKLADFYQSQADAEYAQTRKAQVGTGDRSERIRTYNFPQDRVTDHRINFTQHNLPGFLCGEMQEMIGALRQAELQKNMALK